MRLQAHNERQRQHAAPQAHVHKHTQRAVPAGVPYAHS